MSLGIIPFLQLVAILTICQNGPSSALHVEISPKTVNELITDQASITCLANDSPYWTQKVMVLSMGKSGKPPLATLAQGQQIQFGVGKKPNLQAEGVIDKNASNSYLRLTLQKPGLEDAGVYSCQMYYLNGYGQLKEGKAYANMTVENENEKAVLLHLLKRVSELEKEARQKNSELKHQEILMSDQGKLLKDQQDHMKTVDTMDEDLLKTVLGLKKAVTQQNKKLEDQRILQQRQGKLVTDQGKQLKEQHDSMKELDKKGDSNTAAFNNLLTKVSNLEKTSTQQVNKQKGQESKLTQQGQSIADQGKQLKEQGERITEIHANDNRDKSAVNNLKTKVSNLEKTSTQQVSKLKDQENKLKRQEQSITDQGNRLTEQEKTTKELKSNDDSLLKKVSDLEKAFKPKVNKKTTDPKVNKEAAEPKMKRKNTQGSIFENMKKMLDCTKNRNSPLCGGTEWIKKEPEPFPPQPRPDPRIGPFNKELLNQMENSKSFTNERMM